MGRVSTTTQKGALISVQMHLHREERRGRRLKQLGKVRTRQFPSLHQPDTKARSFRGTVSRLIQETPWLLFCASLSSTARELLLGMSPPWPPQHHQTLPENSFTNPGTGEVVDTDCGVSDPQLLFQVSVPQSHCCPYPETLNVIAKKRNVWFSRNVLSWKRHKLHEQSVSPCPYLLWKALR